MAEVLESTSEIVVLKFGSSVIPTERAIERVVRELGARVARGERVVAVVSAVGGATDALLNHARSYVSPDAAGDVCSAHALAAYVATGEAQSVALLGLALARAGLRAEVLDAAAVGLRTEGPALDAHPCALDDAALHAALARAPIVVIPGFVGRDELGRTTLLGRGGSDLTAMFVASELGARCRLVKDVDGLYDRDPAEDGRDGEGRARRYRRASWDDVLKLDEGIVQHKAVKLARSLGLAFEVGTIGGDGGTRIGDFGSEFEEGSFERRVEEGVVGCVG